MKPTTRPKPLANRKRAHEAIDMERDYQVSRFCSLDEVNSSGDFLVYMRNYLDKAFASNNPASPGETMKFVRKVSAIGMAAMEKFGVGDE